MLSRKFKPNNLPIYSKTQEYFSGSSAENVQAPVFPEKAPWHRKACSVDSSLINFVSKQENPELMKNLAQKESISLVKSCLYSVFAVTFCGEIKLCV